MSEGAGERREPIGRARGDPRAGHHGRVLVGEQVAEESSYPCRGEGSRPRVWGPSMEALAAALAAGLLLALAAAPAGADTDSADASFQG